MRRRWTASEADCDPPVQREKCDRVANPSSVRDEDGNVRSSGMADQGIGRPVSEVKVLKPRVTDLGSDSDASSDEDSISDSEDSENDPRFNSNNSLSCDAIGTVSPRLSVDGSTVLPAGSAVASPIQQASTVTTYGNINLNKSSGIHIGNKTVYQGPVTIQQYVVKQADESLQVRVGPLAITDGSETGIVGPMSGSNSKRTGLELSTGSFRIGASAVAASKGSGLLWRHLLGRRPGATTMAAWIALGLGCMALVALVLAVVYFLGKKEQSAPPTSDADFEAEEVNNGYRSPVKQQNRTILGRRRLVVVPRREWVAQPPKSTTALKHPVEYVIISQTATDPCTTQAECTLTVRYLQVFHVEGKKWMDIAYNFMVAGDGQAYEGRGWDVVGAHTAAGFNGISIGISFVGTFSDVLPPPVQIRACKLLIEEGVKLGKISANFKMIADRQVSQSENPGKKFYEELQTWDHWTANV